MLDKDIDILYNQYIYKETIWRKLINLKKFYKFSTKGQGEPMKVTRKLAPGLPGTKREQKLHKETLLCVRYLSDGNGRYMKTKEIIIYDYQCE